MNYDSIYNLQVKKELDSNFDTLMFKSSFNEMYDLARQQLTDLKIAYYQIQSNIKSLEIVRGQLLPSLSLYGAYA